MAERTTLQRLARRPLGLGRHLAHNAFWRLGPRIGVLRQYSPKPLQVAVPEVAGLPDCQLPSISMATPSFNQARFVKTTVLSVLDQAYPNLEYVLRDGGSTDGSVGELETLDHPNFRWHSEPDDGQANAVNLSFVGSSGEVMGWINSDDILLPGSLRAIGEYFATHPHVDAVYGHRVLIDHNGDDIGKWIVPDHDSEAIKWADYVPQETLFWRRELWEKVGGLDESFRFALDWDLLLRFEDAGASIKRLPYFLGGFRIYDEQLTSSVMESLGAEEMDRLRRRCHGRNVTQAEIAKALLPYLMKHMKLHYRWRLGL